MDRKKGEEDRNTMGGVFGIRITQLHRGKKGNDISGRYALIGCRLVTKISQVEINPQRVFFREF